MYSGRSMTCIYSGTSLKGLSVLRTQYKKTSLLRTSFQSQWYHANTFLPLKEENLYITAKMTWSQSVHYKEVPLYLGCLSTYQMFRIAMKAQ